MSWLKREHLPFTSNEISEMGAFNLMGRSCGCEESLMVLWCNGLEIRYEEVHHIFGKNHSGKEFKLVLGSL